MNIAMNGAKIANEMLTPENMYCYYAMALKKYSELQVGDFSDHSQHEFRQFDPDAKSRTVCKCQFDSRFRDEL